MSNSLALKKLPAPVRSLLRPMLFAAIGLHALLLFTPMPSEEKPKKPDDKENPVKITQLPTAKVAARPKLAKPVLPKIDRPKPAVDAPPVPKPPPKPAVSDAGKADATASKDKDPFADFPRYNPSTLCSVKPDLGENYCRDASGSMTSVASFFKDTLTKETKSDKKLDIFRDGGDGTKAQIFKVSKGKVFLYLSILKDSETKTVYVLGKEKIENLDVLKASQVTPIVIKDILATVSPTTSTSDPSGGGSSSNNASSFDFQKPDDFYTDVAADEPNPAIVDLPRVVDGKSADQVYADLKTYLDSKTIASNKVGNYGGGTLYEIKKDSFTGYLNLVPHKNGKGTIVVVWTKDPR